MNSTLLVVKESLIRRKKQYFFLSITLFLCTLLFTIAINLLKVADRPFDDNFERSNASHILLFFDTERDSYREIANWYRRQPEVVRVTDPIPYLLFDGGFIHDDQQIKTAFHLTEYIYQKDQDHLTILNPDAGKAPRYNEVWLPYHFSINHGLKIGDTLQFQFPSGSFDFVISSFVVDPHFLSGLFNPSRIFFAPGALAIYQPTENLSNMMVGIKLKDPDFVRGIYSRFLSQTEYSGSMLDYQLFKSAFNGIYSILSAVLFFFAVMIFAIALLVLNGTLSSQVFADYKQIGVMKTLGFTPAGIRKIYLWKLTLLSLVAIPLGVLAAYFSLLLIIGYMNSSSGLAFHPDAVLIYHLVPGLIIIVLTLIVTLFTSYKAGSVSALQAIRNGDRDGGELRSPVSLKKLPSEIIMGIRFLLGRPVAAFILCVSFIVESFLLTFVTGIGASLEQVKSHRSDWGLIDADLQISLENDVFMPLDKSEFLSLFSTWQASVDKLIPFSYSHIKIRSGDDMLLSCKFCDDTLPTHPFPLKGQSCAPTSPLEPVPIYREERGVSVGKGNFMVNLMQEARGIIYDLDMRETGFHNLEGTHPDGPGDIALCIGTAKSVQRTVGDSIDVIIHGGLHRLFVCGIYQDVSAFGQGFRLHASAMQSVNPLHKTDQFGVKLKKEADIERFKSGLSSFFGEKISVEKSLENRSAFLSMIGNLRIGILLVALFFIAIISIMVANDLNIHINRERLVIAKLKAIGFTDLQVKYALAFKNSVIILTGTTLGVLLSVFTGRALISGLTFSIGLVDFPYEASFVLITAVFAIILTFGYLASWRAMRIISNIHPTQLKSL